MVSCILNVKGDTKGSEISKLDKAIVVFRHTCLTSGCMFGSTNLLDIRSRMADSIA